MIRRSRTSRPAAASELTEGVRRCRSAPHQKLTSPPRPLPSPDEIAFVNQTAGLLRSPADFAAGLTNITFDCLNNPDTSADAEVSYAVVRSLAMKTLTT